MWSEARPIAEYLNRVKSYKGLTFVDRKMSAYGDWTLYVDESGNYWEEYDSIGD